jgi:hypothetical protein
MKRTIISIVKMVLWYEAELASTRLWFAGGVLAGTLISFLVGMVVGFGYESAIGSIVFSVGSFIVFTFFSGLLFGIGRKYGDRKPVCDILKEAEHGSSGSNGKTPEDSR